MIRSYHEGRLAVVEKDLMVDSPFDTAIIDLWANRACCWPYHQCWFLSASPFNETKKWTQWWVIPPPLCSFRGTSWITAYSTARYFSNTLRHFSIIQSSLKGCMTAHALSLPDVCQYLWRSCLSFHDVEHYGICSRVVTVVAAGSPSHGGNVVVYVKDMNQPSLPTPFCILFLCLFFFW